MPERVVARRHLLTVRPWPAALLLAGLAGVALWAAHPPVAARPLAFLVAPLLVTALRLGGGGGARDRDAPAPLARRALALGMLAGALGYGPMISWLIPPAGMLGWALLVTVQAAWLGLWAVLVAPWLRSRLLPIVASVLWVGMDVLRGEVPLSGFSWGTMAYALAGSDWFTPLGRLLGASGVTLVVILISVAGLESLLALWGGDREHPAKAPLAQLVGATLLTTLITIGPPPTVGTLDVLAVQGNDIRHWLEQPPAAPRVIASNLRDLTLAEVERAGAPDLAVWPESAIDRDPRRPEWADLGVMAQDAASAAGLLVTGVALDGPDPARERIIGALLLDRTGEIDRYVKRKPVPFGEYVPARRWIDWFPALDQIPRDAVPGAGPASFQVRPGVDVAVAICFETLYGSIVRTNILAAERPAGIILAITNDASFRESAEPAQHLAQSRMRAIETGRWVVHAALSGSSAFIDPNGRVHEATDVFTATVIRRDVPLVEGFTPYLRFGDFTGNAGAALLIALIGGRWTATAVRRRAVVQGRSGPRPGR